MAEAGFGWRIRGKSDEQEAQMRQLQASMKGRGNGVR